MGYVLSNLFVSLCTEGFCNTKEEEGKEAANKFDDADGTGMGEGEGKKDVSEQIEDEEQLMGGTEKVSSGNWTAPFLPLCTLSFFAPTD